MKIVKAYHVDKVIENSEGLEFEDLPEVMLNGCPIVFEDSEGQVYHLSRYNFMDLRWRETCKFAKVCMRHLLNQKKEKEEDGKEKEEE